MRRGSYYGASTQITVSEDGTNWPSTWDTTSMELADNIFKRWDSRDDLSPNKKVRYHKRRRKAFGYFLKACAIAFRDEKLSFDFPPPPKWLANDVKRAGGTAEWIAADHALVALLTRLIKCTKLMKTSHSDPLQILVVRAGDNFGRIGITLCLGKYDPHAMTGAWARDLGTDLDVIRNWGASAIVTALSSD